MDRFNPIDKSNCQPIESYITSPSRYRVYKLSYETLPPSVTMYILSFICARLMNNLGYGQLLNANCSFKLVLMCEGNYQEHLVRYFYYLGQGFYHISFIESILSNTDSGRSHLDHTITFKDFMLLLILDVLEISFPY